MDLTIIGDERTQPLHDLLYGNAVDPVQPGHQQGFVFLPGHQNAVYHAGLRMEGAGEDAQKGVRRSIDDGVRVMEQGGDLLQRYDDLFIAPGGDAEDQQVDLFQKRVAQGFVI